MAKNLTAKEDRVREWLLGKLDQDNLDPSVASTVVSSYVALTNCQTQAKRATSTPGKSS